MKEKSSIREGTIFGTALIYLIVIFMSFAALYPMYYVLVISLSDPQYASTLNVYWFPKSATGIYLEAYKQLIQDSKLWAAYWNTIVYTILPTFFMLITCSMCAYPLTSPKLIGKRYINFFLLVPMYFGGGLIPFFILMTKLGLYSNMWSVVLPASVSIWYIILTRTYFASIPEEMREASKIDGANNYQCLFRIYIPNAKPILAVIAIYTLVARWNSWYDALIFLPKPETQPLQLYLRRILLTEAMDIKSALTTSDMAALAMKQMSNDQLKYAMIIFTTLPMIFAYPFLQRYFVKGVMVGSLKG